MKTNHLTEKSEISKALSTGETLTEIFGSQSTAWFFCADGLKRKGTGCKLQQPFRLGIHSADSIADHLLRRIAIGATLSR